MLTKFKIQKAAYKEMLFDADFAFASICGNGQIDAKIIDVWVQSYLLIRQGRIQIYNQYAQN